MLFRSVVADGSNETTLLLDTVSNTSEQVLEVVFTPAVSAIFNVNGVEKGVITTGLPFGSTASGILFNVSVQTETNSVVNLYINYYDFWQAN